MDSYRTLAAPATARLTRERSRFIAHVEPAAGLDDIEARLAEIRHQYHDATHVCHAYRYRAGDAIIERADDAGEPGGSAGAPILQQLAVGELVDVLAAVVRYFGGVKLGTGGLARAYGAVTAAALAEAPTIVRRVETILRILFPVEANPTVMRLLHRHGARVIDIRYDSRGAVTAALPSSHASAFAEAVREATGARACVEEAR